MNDDWSTFKSKGKKKSDARRQLEQQMRQEEQMRQQEEQRRIQWRFNGFVRDMKRTYGSNIAHSGLNDTLWPAQLARRVEFPAVLWLRKEYEHDKEPHVSISKVNFDQRGGFHISNRDDVHTGCRFYFRADGTGVFKKCKDNDDPRKYPFDPETDPDWTAEIARLRNKTVAFLRNRRNRGPYDIV